MRRGAVRISAIAQEALDKLRADRFARAEAEAKKAAPEPDAYAGLSLLDAIPVMEPKYAKPIHFAELCDLIDQACRGIPVRVVIHGPPQHGKTSLLQSGIALGLKKRPDLTFGYGTYGDRLAKSKSRHARALAKRIGVKLETSSVNEWRTPEGGGLLATSVGGPLTGNKVDVMFIDDPVKDRAQAQSRGNRESKKQWFDDVVNTRIHPTGSIFCFGARWHPDDLSGYLIKEHGFRYLCFKAIENEGTPNEKALAPHLFDVKDFASKRRKPITWLSLFQGEPRLPGTTVFKPPVIVAPEAWPTVYQHAFGVDGAYSEKTAADHSAVVRLLRAKIPGDPLPHFFVAYVQREQELLPAFRRRLKQLDELYPGAVGWRWYVATSELGGSQMMSDGEEGVPVHGMIAKGDKYARALAVSEAWNDGRVHVDHDAPWAKEFLEEVMLFTGVDDPEDDMVDALAAAFDLLNYQEDDELVDKPTRLKHHGVGAADQ